MDAIKKIEAALAAGPMDGPWIAAGPSFGDPVPRYFNEVIVEHEEENDAVCDCFPGGDPESSVTMAYIAEVNPAAIREVLQTLAAKDAEVARLKLSEFAAQSAAGHLGALVDELRKVLAHIEGATTDNYVRSYARNALTQPTEQPK